MKTLTIDDCRGVAARIWCDPDYQHMVMNVYLCEMIAQMLFVESNKQIKEKDRENEMSANFLKGYTKELV